MSPTAELDNWPISELGSHPDTVLEKINESRHPVVLTREGRGVAVMVDVESYEDLVEELALLRDVHRGLADVEAGRVIPHDEVSDLLKKRYAP